MLGFNTVPFITIGAGGGRWQAERADKILSGFAHNRQLGDLQRCHVQVAARCEHALGNIDHRIR